MRPMLDEPLLRVRTPRASVSQLRRVFDGVCLFGMVGGLTVVGLVKDDATQALTEMTAALVVFLAVLFWMASREL